MAACHSLLGCWMNVYGVTPGVLETEATDLGAEVTFKREESQNLAPLCREGHAGL